MAHNGRTNDAQKVTAKFSEIKVTTQVWERGGGGRREREGSWNYLYWVTRQWQSLMEMASVEVCNDEAFHMAGSGSKGQLGVCRLSGRSAPKRVSIRFW